MAEIAPEVNNEVPVEKEVVEVDAPKVVENDENVAVENGNGQEAEAAPAEAEAEIATSTEEKAEEKAEEVTSAEAEEVEAEAKAKNGDNTDAAPEAVKRKIIDEATEAVADEASPLPEKKSKVEESAHENGAAEAEVVA